MSTIAKEAISELKKNRRKYFERCLKIRNKNSDIVNFKPNKAQEELIDLIDDWKSRYPNPKERPTLYVVIPKPRQVGYSTVTEAIFFHELNFSYNKVAMVISYDQDSAAAINDMSNRFFQYLPQVIKPMRRKSMGKGILFENPNFNPNIPMDEFNEPGLQSKFMIETANNVNAGSSYTINYLHISELAKWKNPEATLTSLLQSVPKTDAVVIVESTANGLNYFYKLCNDAKHGRNNYKLVFIPWYKHDEYKTTYTGFELNHDERMLNKTYGVTFDQLQWRRDTINDKCQGSLDIFHQEYPTYLEEAFVTTGKPVFDVSQVNDRMNNLKQTVEKGYFVYELDEKEKIIDGSVEWVDDKFGYVSIFEKPKRGYPYVIGGDTAGDGSDNFIGQVLDNTTGVQVARLKHRLNEDLYAQQMYCLGRYYNTALLAIEVNFSTYPIKELQRLNYPNMYIREVEDTITKQIIKKFGFRTDRLTRPVIIAELVKIVRESIESINDYDTLEEMTTFVRNESGRPEAMSDCHDDCIMALAIAHYARPQMRFIVHEEAPYIENKLIDTIKPKKKLRM